MESGQIHPTFESVCRRYQELDSDEDLSAVELEALLKAEIGEVEDSDREDSAHERIHKSWDWRTIKGVARKKPSPKSDQT
ncbi:MAG: hypothetical protein FJ118_12585 [Deltaproteobacteria bacterium]|nr:hypothetical protein [Deltaproteobacteria bacterium]